MTAIVPLALIVFFALEIAWILRAGRT